MTIRRHARIAAAGSLAAGIVLTGTPALAGPPDEPKASTYFRATIDSSVGNTVSGTVLGPGGCSAPLTIDVRRSVDRGATAIGSATLRLGEGCGRAVVATVQTRYDTIAGRYTARGWVVTDRGLGDRVTLGFRVGAAGAAGAGALHIRTLLTS